MKRHFLEVEFGILTIWLSFIAGLFAGIRSISS
jgi:hypothetical protein